MPGGFKDFGAEVLASADVDEYLMRQSIMRFASTSARDTALSGNLEEGMFAWNSDSDELWFYDGTAWIAKMSVWTSFTPSWTNLTLGAGNSQSAEYRYINGDLRVRGVTTLGTAPTVGTNPSFTVPNSETARATGGGNQGSAYFVDDSTGDLDCGICLLDASGSEIRFVTADGGALSATVPFTWASSDTIRFDMLVAL